MNQNDSFEIAENKGLTSLILAPTKSMQKPGIIKIIDLSKEFLDKQNDSAETVMTHEHLPIGKRGRHLIDQKVIFWNQLKQMPDASIKEQLHDLLLLCDLKNKHPEAQISDKILSFSFDLVKNNHSIGTSKIRSIIGKLIYLINQDISQLTLLINNQNEDEKIQQIETCFENELNKIKSALLKFAEDHEAGIVQDKLKALSVRIPVELAKALISDTGYVNIGIIEPLMNRFLTKTRKLPFEKNIAFALNSIKRSSLLRQKLQLISCPFSQILPANDLIRITLGLPADSITTSIDAKKTALAALISHMRQSPASSCFASYLAIELLSKQLAQCLDDFCELLQKNNLSRFVDGKQKEFSFLMCTGKGSASQIINLDKDGKIHSNEGLSCYIWKVPGFKAACQSIGLNPIKKSLQHLCMELSEKNKSDRSAISISKLLKLIAKKLEGDPVYRFNCAKLSFESQLHNPLLRIWENVIASMAEATKYGKITEAMIHSITQPLEKLYGNHLIIRRQIRKKIVENLKMSAYYAYDADIKSNQISNDGRSGRGAFILYDRCGSTNRGVWKLIENADDFRQFVISIVHQSFSLIKNKEPILGEIKEFILKEQFLIDCLHFYHVENSQLSDKELIQNLKTLPHTPWKDKTGNNSNEVLRVYFDKKDHALPITLTPKNATKLFLSLIEIGRKFPEKVKRNLNENPELLTPLIIKGIHAFSMTFGHETMMKALNSKKPSDDWIRENLIAFGKEISDSKIADDAKLKLINLVIHSAIPKNDKEGLAKFHEKINSMSGDLTISAFRNHLISVIKEVSDESYYPLKTIAQGIDFFIYKYVISEEARQKLVASSVHFADTNWDAKLHDVHFCFIFNTGSGRLEIWEVYEDGSGLYPLSQEDWISKQTWEIYTPDL